MSGKIIKKIRLVENASCTPGTLDGEFLIESHHNHYGHPWLGGRYVFDFLVHEGLRPCHKVLDVGCGSGRIGIHLLRYLDPGHYFGIDVHRKSLEAFAKYEMFLHGLEDRGARLLWNGSFDAEHFGVEFDWVLDVATTLHLSPREVVEAFTKITKTLAPGGILVVGHPRPDLALNDLAKFGLVKERAERLRCEKLEGHDFQSSVDFIFFRKRGP